MTQPRRLAGGFQEDTLNLLPTQFKERPVIEGILKNLAREFQELEDVFYDGLFIKHLYNNLSADRLDKLGRLLGVTRDIGDSDAVVRRKIVGEILRRSSNGTPDRIREILQTLTPLTDMQVFEHEGGAAMFYGVTQDPEFLLTGDEPEFISEASPNTSGSVVFGYVNGDDRTSLFVPSEVSFDFHNLVVDGTDDGTENFQNLVMNDGVVLRNLVVRPTFFATGTISRFGAEAQSGILPELDQVREEFLRADLENGEQDFVQVELDETGRELLKVGVEGTDNTRGVMLEILQRDDDQGRRYKFGGGENSSEILIDQILPNAYYIVTINEECFVHFSGNSPTYSSILSGLFNEISGSTSTKWSATSGVVSITINQVGSDLIEVSQGNLLRRNSNGVINNRFFLLPRGASRYIETGQRLIPNPLAHFDVSFSLYGRLLDGSLIAQNITSITQDREFQIYIAGGKLGVILGGSVSVAEEDITGGEYRIRYDGTTLTFLKDSEVTDTFTPDISSATIEAGASFVMLARHNNSSSQYTFHSSATIANVTLRDSSEVITHRFPINDNNTVITDTVSGDNGTLGGAATGDWDLMGILPDGNWLGQNRATVLTVPSFSGVPSNTVVYRTVGQLVSGFSYRISATVSSFTGVGDTGYSTTGNLGVPGITPFRRVPAVGDTIGGDFTAIGTGVLRIFARPTNTVSYSDVIVKQILMTS